MPSSKHKTQRFLITFLVLVLLATGTMTAIYFAKGYRLSTNQGLSIIQGTGLLSATSHPNAAQVFIDDKLITATEDTVNLVPGEYNIRITKEGFLPWQKKVTIQNELVAAVDARLFPAVPSLSALTYTGASNPLPSPDGKKIAYIITNSDDDAKNGLYVMDINSNILSLNRSPNLLATNTSRFNLEDGLLTWSPDSKEILIAFTDESKDPRITNSYLLNIDDVTNLNTAPDVTLRLSLILSEWESELIRTQTTLLANLPEFMSNLATSSAQNVYFSPTGEKMIYTSSIDTTIPDNLIPSLASVNSTPQNRNLKKGYRYIYDLKEDTNYEIGEQSESDHAKFLLNPTLSFFNENASISAANREITSNQLQKDKTPYQTILAFKAYHSALFTNTPQWYPTSRHLISTKDNKITIFEYDNLNQTVIYSGPFDPTFVYPSPSGDRLIILTNLNQNDQPLNLYTLDLK